MSESVLSLSTEVNEFRAKLDESISEEMRDLMARDFLAFMITSCEGVWS